MTTQYGYICIRNIEAQTVGVQKMRCPALSWIVKEGVHFTQFKYFEDAYTNLNLGKENVF